MAAAAGGATRVELCASLFTGGLTPSIGVVRESLQVPGIEIMCMVRPREGDFCYAPAEFAGMLADVDAFRDIGAHGVVFGVLLPDGTVDVERNRQLITRAKPMTVTFHRAFDVTMDAAAALESLIALGIDRVLTSGQCATAPEGTQALRALVKQASGRIGILPGCGITAENVAALVRQTGVQEVHATAFAKTASPMRHRNPVVYMGAPGLEEFEREITDPVLVKEMIDALQKI